MQPTTASSHLAGTSLHQTNVPLQPTDTSLPRTAAAPQPTDSVVTREELERAMNEMANRFTAQQTSLVDQILARLSNREEPSSQAGARAESRSGESRERSRDSPENENSPGGSQTHGRARTRPEDGHERSERVEPAHDPNRHGPSAVEPVMPRSERHRSGNHYGSRQHPYHRRSPPSPRVTVDSEERMTRLFRDYLRREQLERGIGARVYSPFTRDLEAAPTPESGRCPPWNLTEGRRTPLYTCSVIPNTCS